MQRHCHHCGAALPPEFAVGRRDTCAGCGWDLRCCRNCDHYAVGYNNECRENQAERQVDKVAGNFCDFFRFRAKTESAAPAPTNPRSALDALFKKRK